VTVVTPDGDRRVMVNVNAPLIRGFSYAADIPDQFHAENNVVVEDGFDEDFAAEEFCCE
jgi:hypothetical protein